MFFGLIYGPEIKLIQRLGLIHKKTILTNHVLSNIITLVYGEVIEWNMALE